MGQGPPTELGYVNQHPIVPVRIIVFFIQETIDIQSHAHMMVKSSCIYIVSIVLMKTKMSDKQLSLYQPAPY